MSENKRYQLLKDLPQCKAGTIFEKYSEDAIDYVALGILQWDSGKCKKVEVFLLDCHVENNSEWFELITERPPIDIMPEMYWKEERSIELGKCIQSYWDRCITVPSDWIAEKARLEKELGLREEGDVPVKVEKFVWTDELVKEFVAIYSTVLPSGDLSKYLDAQIAVWKMNNPKAPIKVDAGKEWEIVSFICKDGDGHVIYNKCQDGKFRQDRCPDLSGYDERDFGLTGEAIHSVKRLSDNQTFTITDEGRTKKSDDKVFVIESFEILDNTMWITCKHKYGYESQRDTFKLQHFQKLPSPTTQQTELPSCPICGGPTVLIRGKYPGTDKRNVCAQCTTERLEQIAEISSSSYGQVCKSN